MRRCTVVACARHVLVGRDHVGNLLLQAKAMENQFSVEREAFIYQIRELTKSEMALKMKLKSRELERKESLSTPASHSPPLVPSLKRSSVPKSVTLDPAVTYNDMTREAYQDALQQIEQSKRARKSMLTEVSGIEEITKQQQAWLEKIIKTKETEMLRMTLKELAERTTAMTEINIGWPSLHGHYGPGEFRRVIEGEAS